MGMLKVHCGKCGKPWDVYHRDNWNSREARTCPHCFAEVDPQTWKQVVRAFADMSDANMELAKDHEQGAPLVTVDYIEDYSFTD